MSAAKKVIGAHGGFVHSPQARARRRTSWGWPRAALTIIMLSLLLWGGILGIASLALD